MKAGIILALFLLFACRPPEAAPESHHEEHDHEAEENPSNVGPDQAVVEMSEEKGFRLSPQAIRTLGIETMPVQNSKAADFPASALVYYQAEVGVYRLREGWFRLVPLDHLDELKRGDSVAIRGAAFLRVTDMSLFGEQQSGHHH